MSGFNLLQLENVPIYQQLQIEEALLRTDERNWCILNKGSPPAIVMGISGKAEELIDSDEFTSNPMPIIRRFSGGGTVVVDEHTVFVTWIVNSEEMQVACCPKKMLQWTAAFYQEAFPAINFLLVENDYAIGERKCAGNAQYMRKGRWLHHTSFLWDYRSENMRLLKMPLKMPAYRQKRPHEDFICRLSHHFKDYQTFSEQLLSHLQCRLQPTVAEVASIQPLLSGCYRRATSLVSL